jgi:Pex19 protein family
MLENNPEFQSVMEGMVNDMISKDVLYEPMKELREKVGFGCRVGE